MTGLGQCGIAPWLSVSDGAKAVAFYIQAFGASEVYHVEDPTGAVVSRLSVGGAEFWLSGDSPTAEASAGAPPNDGAVRMILTVPDPDVIFERAVQAGATMVFPVQEDYGWRVGRLADPFGHHWEIGRPLEA